MTQNAIAAEIKNEIIRKAKEDACPVAELSKQYGISDKTIYAWLKIGASPGATIVANNRLRRENEQLIHTIGCLTVALHKQKKGAQLEI